MTTSFPSQEAEAEEFGVKGVEEVVYEVRFPAR